MRTHPLPASGATGGGLPVVRPSLHSPPDEQREAKILVARLRERIARMEDSHYRLEQKRERQDLSAGLFLPWRFDVTAVDAHLPEQGLSRHTLHDLAPERYGDMPATMGFAAALAVKRLNVDQKRRPILWCRSTIECKEHGKLYGHGLERLGLSRNKLLFLYLKRQVSVFWTMEEALKSGCFSSVISDAAPQHTDLSITRRLSLSAGEGRSSGLLVFTRNYQDATASFSRWQVATASSPLLSLEPGAPGYPAWAVTLSRIRGGRPGQWTLIWHPQQRLPTVSYHASHHFSLVSGISGGALSQGTAQAGQTLKPQRPALRAG
jgi:protein ImuA